MRIGFLGLGNMGGPMAAHLLNGGHEMRVWNRSPAGAAKLVDLGAVAVATAAEAFDAEVAFTMLADDRALRDILIDSGLLDRLGPPLIHVNMATVSVALAEELAGRWKARGVAYVAAPVMGRPDAAATAKLNILAAGPDAAVEAVQPLLALMGQKVWRLGEQAQRANVAKLAVNFLLASAVETLGEATVLAGAYGIAAQQLIDLISGSIFPGPVYQGYGALIAQRRYEPAGFKAELALKDVRLALAAADAVSVPLPVGSMVRDSLTDAIAHQEGGMDLAVLGKVAARRAGR
ncbi:MAG TPA: NAD(P)-dependent oxidoreductase [Acetobacteraceae bacterium]|nr:NAD(P)-dependent oxidoreductase [Acetobacteraceae bacterium]